MGHLIKVERFGQGNELEESRAYTAPSWEGVWRAVEEEMDRTGKVPSGMEGWNENGCVFDEGHDCDTDPDRCREHLKASIRNWIRAAWEYDPPHVGSFHFAGPSWSAITIGWDEG